MMRGRALADKGRAREVKRGNHEMPVLLLG